MSAMTPPDEDRALSVQTAPKSPGPGPQTGSTPLPAEPLPAEHPFWRHPRIRITPHVAAVTQVPESARQIAAKILRFERGEPAGGVVDRSRGY